MLGWEMPELRKDYVTNGWVVISSERADRPNNFKTAMRPDIEAGAKADIGKCPFCPGNESMTPPEILAYRTCGTAPNTQGWWVRGVANKFPALRIEDEVNHRVDQLFNRMNGVGAHEVIVETPDHGSSIATMPVKQVEEVMNAYKDRYVDLTKDKRFRYILIFKNHGSEAGASLIHPHSQLIATPIIPRRLMDELEGARNYYHATGGNCIFDDIIKEEIYLQERIVLEEDCFVALAPFASRFPFETWIIPKNHDPLFESMDDERRHHLAVAMKTVLKQIHDLLGDPPYNYYIHTSPCDRNDYRFYHWHIEISPRLTHAAGFERGSGFYINPMPPEKAAQFLRQGIMKVKDSL